VLLGHPICSADVKSFDPRKGSLREDPCLATIKEDGLNNGLVEPRRDVWRCILTSKDLSDTSPGGTGFPKLRLNSPDIVIVLRHHLTKVLEDLDTLQDYPMYQKLLAEGQC
jgi:hypothetical protein